MTLCSLGYLALSVILLYRLYQLRQHNYSIFGAYCQMQKVISSNNKDLESVSDVRTVLFLSWGSLI